MTAEQAQETTRRIRENAEQLRADLYDMYIRRGWEVLGYTSWHAYLVGEFADFYGHAYLRRLTKTALLESDLGIDIGELPESHARPLTEMLHSTEDVRAVYDLVMAKYESPVASDFRRECVDYLLTNYPAKTGTMILHHRWKVGGYIGHATAYKIYLHMMDIDDMDESEEVLNLMSLCSDSKIAGMLWEVKQRYPDLFKEILHSGCIPSFPDPVRIWDATEATLLAWLDIDSAERRARHALNRQDFYAARNAAMARVIEAANHIRNMGVNQETLDNLFKALDSLQDIERNNDEQLRKQEQDST